MQITRFFDGQVSSAMRAVARIACGESRLIRYIMGLVPSHAQYVTYCAPCIIMESVIDSCLVMQGGALVNLYDIRSMIFYTIGKMQLLKPPSPLHNLLTQAW